MSDQIFYMRGRFPFERNISVELVTDAKLVLDLDFDQLQAITAELEAYPGFLDVQIARGIIGHHIDDKDFCKRLSRLVVGIDSRLRGADQSIDDFVSSLRDWQQANQEHNLLSPEDMDELQRRLPLLVRPFPGFKRQAKAKHLAAATGTPLERLEVICDLRPIFDETRTLVEGIIPFTTLKVVCKGVDGLPVSFEALLTELDVQDLAKKASAAVDKLHRLREMLSEKKLTIPSLEMTKRGE